MALLMPLIQRRFDSRGFFVNLRKFDDGGVIHGRPMAINSSSSLRTRSDMGSTFVKGRLICTGWLP
jgi:hypothetical protein